MWRRQIYFSLLNNAVTISLFLILAGRLGNWLAYTVAYAFGLVMIMFANEFVFRVERITFRMRTRYFVFYLGTFFLGQVILHFFHPANLYSRSLVVILIGATSLVLNFFAGRKIFIPKSVS